MQEIAAIAKLSTNTSARFHLMQNQRKTKYDHAVWYSSSYTYIGHKQLARMVPEICMLGNISGHKTNHSLRATGATMLYEAAVPEKIIQERSGHRSLEGLRTYELSSQKQHQAVSNILSSSSQSTYLSQINSEVSSTGVGAIWGRRDITGPPCICTNKFVIT